MRELFLALIKIDRALAGSAGSGGSGGSGSGGGSGTTKSLNTILNDVIGFSVGLGLILATIAIIYAGYQILTAGGDTEKYEKGIKTITYAVGAVFIFLLSKTIISIIQQIIG